MTTDEINTRDLDLTGEPPAAETLGLDVADLPPARARLMRYRAWRQRLAEELEGLEAARARFLESRGVAAVTEAKIRALIDSDTLGLVGWMRSGAAALTPPQIRQFERAQLEEKLGLDHHAAEVARGALDTIEGEIAEKRSALASLEARQESFLADAVAEAADEVAARYLGHLQALSDCLRQLYGASFYLAGKATAWRPAVTPVGYQWALPGFNLPSFRRKKLGPVIRLMGERPDLQRAAAPWRALAAAWAEDPRAAVEMPQPMGRAENAAAEGGAV